MKKAGKINFDVKAGKPRDLNLDSHITFWACDNAPAVSKSLEINKDDVTSLSESNMWKFEVVEDVARQGVDVWVVGMMNAEDRQQRAGSMLFGMVIKVKVISSNLSAHLYRSFLLGYS